MNPEDLRAFARRDWTAIAKSKARFWIEAKRRMDGAEALSIGEVLRRQVLAARPDWPSPSERAEDLSTHARVSAALSRVSRPAGG
jgi:hypothetical protein